MTRTRSSYTADDDMSMIRFLLEEGYLSNGQMGFSINLWKKAQERGVRVVQRAQIATGYIVLNVQITHHSAESMRNRFRRYLLKNFVRLKRSVLSAQESNKRYANPNREKKLKPVEPPTTFSTPVAETVQRLPSKVIWDSVLLEKSPKQIVDSVIVEKSSEITSHMLPMEKASHEKDEVTSPVKKDNLCSVQSNSSHFPVQSHQSLSYALYSFLDYVYSCFGVCWNDNLQLLNVSHGVPQKILTTLLENPALVQKIKKQPGELIFSSRGPFHPFTPVVRTGSALPQEILAEFQ